MQNQLQLSPAPKLVQFGRICIFDHHNHHHATSTTTTPTTTTSTTTTPSPPPQPPRPPPPGSLAERGQCAGRESGWKLRVAVQRSRHQAISLPPLPIFVNNLGLNKTIKDQREDCLSSRPCRCGSLDQAVRQKVDMWGIGFNMYNQS